MTFHTEGIPAQAPYETCDKQILNGTYSFYFVLHIINPALYWPMHDYTYFDMAFLVPNKGGYFKNAIKLTERNSNNRTWTETLKSIF